MAAPVTVIKIGGALIADESALVPMWKALGREAEERRAVVVHGGGPLATEVARRLGHEPRIVQGRRVTSDTDLRIVQWTMRGELNSRLVAQALRCRVPAVGIAGCDARTLRVVKRPPWTIDGESVDFGWVGDIDRVDPALIESLLKARYVPVVAPLGIDEEGLLYNVNADTVACAVAEALEADEFLMVTETGGLRKEAADPDSHIAECSRQLYESGVAEGWITGGMLVKLKVAFDALDAGIRQVHMLGPTDLLDRARGTRVTP